MEVSGPSSRIFDRDFKTAAYLEAGVREVWRVDLRERIVSVSRPGRPLHEPHADRLIWHPPELPEPLTIDLAAVFVR